MSSVEGWPRPWYSDPWQWALLVFGLVLAGVPSVMAIRALIPASAVVYLTGAADNLCTALGAVATFVASGLALWFSQAQARRDRQAKLDAAHIAAATVLTPLERQWRPLWIGSKTAARLKAEFPRQGAWRVRKLPLQVDS